MPKDNTDVKTTESFHAAVDAKMIVTAPLNYLGNRAASYDDVFTALKQHRAQYETCYDLFSGSLSMTLKAMQYRLAKKYVVNDVFAPLQLFWQVLKNTPQSLYESYTSLEKSFQSTNNHDQSLFYQSQQNKVNASLQSTKGQPKDLPPAQQIEFAAIFAFLMNYAEHGLPKVKSSGRDLQLDCKLSVTPSHLNFTEAVQSISQYLANHQIEITCCSFEQFLPQIREQDLVILDPPYPDLADNVYERPQSKETLSQKLQSILTDLDRHKITFVMFYGALGLPNEYPIRWPQGHVLRISGDSQSAFGEYIEHAYFSTNVVGEIERLELAYRQKLQPPFYRLVETHALSGPYKRGDETALVFGDSKAEQMTYAQMNAAANRLSHYMREKLAKYSLVTEPLIALYLPRGPLLIISLLAMMKSGLPYLPLETDRRKSPEEEALSRIRLSQAKYVITQHGRILDEKVLSQTGTQQLTLDPNDTDCKHLPGMQDGWSSNPGLKVNKEHLAYVMYTSGSTGEPKGVEVLQRGLTYAFESHQDLLNLAINDRILQFGSVGFDASLMEIMMGLGCGGKLYLPSEEVITNAQQLQTYLEQHKISVMIQTPKMLKQLHSKSLSHLRCLLIVGEAFDKSLSNQWLVSDEKGELNRVVVNGYGLTETTIVTTLGVCRVDQPLSIGEAILGLKVYLRPLELELDQFEEPFEIIDAKAIAKTVKQSEWIASTDAKNSISQEGVLYVSGACLARGYWQRKDLTQARFYEVDGQTYYRTGDKGYFDKGQLVLSGRIDRQVKIRGQRLELGEVEQTLLAIGKNIIKSVRVAAHSNSPHHEKSLVAYIEPTDVFKKSEQAQWCSTISAYLPRLFTEIKHSTVRISDLVAQYSMDEKHAMDKKRHSQELKLLEFLRNKMTKSAISSFKIPDINRMMFVPQLKYKDNDKKSIDDKQLTQTFGTGPFALLAKSQKPIPSFATKQEQALWDWLYANFMKVLELGREDFNPLDYNFMALGGTSLKVSMLLESLQRDAHKHRDYVRAICKLTVEDIWHRTVADLWQIIKEKQLAEVKSQHDKKQHMMQMSRTSSDYLLLKNTNMHEGRFYGNYRVPLFAVHSLLGDAKIDYLGKGLEKLPMRLEPLSLSSENLQENLLFTDAKAADLWLDKVVQTHLQIVKQKQREGGPYWLLGWSTGGVIAYRMAQQLRQEKARVFLWLLDAHHPSFIQQQSSLQEQKLLADVEHAINKALIVALDLPSQTPFNLHAKYVRSQDEKNHLFEVNHYFKQLQQQLTNKLKDLKSEESQKTRARNIVTSAHSLYQAELLCSMKNDLGKDDYLVVADAKVSHTLGWKLEKDAISKGFNCDHFSLLMQQELPDYIKAELIQQIGKIDAPFYQGISAKHKEKNSKAFQYFKEAANAGHPAAQDNLGYCCINGIGTRKDPQLAVKWFKKAAAQGFAYAQYNLGLSYDEGTGIDKDKIKAAEYYTKAAEQGHPQAQNNLGHCYRFGHGVSKDLVEAFKCYQKAVALEPLLAKANNNLGHCYRYGHGVGQDNKKAFKCYKNAAMVGDADGQFHLAVCYDEGTGTAKNAQKAVEWYTRAAEQGVPHAQLELGFFYSEGKRVAKNEDEAFKWYLKAAKQGLRLAQFSVSICYGDGTGVKRNPREAFKWAIKAADQNMGEAMCNVGYHYEYGLGVRKNLNKAIEYYTKAAQRGVAQAQFNLADCYEEGAGTDLNKAEALKWYQAAAKQKHVDAQNAVKRLEKEFAASKPSNALQNASDAQVTFFGKSQKDSKDHPQPKQNISQNIASSARFMLLGGHQVNADQKRHEQVQANSVAAAAAAASPTLSP